MDNFLIKVAEWRSEATPSVASSPSSPAHCCLLGKRKAAPSSCSVVPEISLLPNRSEAP